MPRTATDALVVAVVGGGLAGLSAAHELAARGAVPIVLEAGAQVGGKLRVSEVGGVAVDEGADSMLRRVPYGVDLANKAGLELVSPSASGAFVWTRGRLRPLPSGTVMGVPAQLGPLARSGVLSRTGLARVPWDLVAPGAPLEEDISVGHVVGRRLGREVVERLVDPLLGGVYAGRADQLSVQATLPALFDAARGQRSLVQAARAARGVPTPGPVFAGLAGGLGQLPGVLAQGLDVRVGTTVTRISRTGESWRLDLGRDGGYVDADAVVLAVPARRAARLLAGVAGAAAVEELARVDYASVVIVTLVLDGVSPGAGTGYLVPAVEGLDTKAVTFTSRKWGLAGPAVVRASLGRAGEEWVLQRSDEELVASVRRDLAAVLGPQPALRASRVSRWGGGLPQYAVGHVDLVRRLRATLPAGVAVAGAAYDGVGVPAVVRSGQLAARAVLAGDR